MSVDLLHPLMADGAGGDDEGGPGGDGLHSDQAVRAVERCGVQTLFFVVDTLCVLPQLAVQTLNSSLVVDETQLTTDALEAIVWSVEGEKRRSGRGFTGVFEQRRLSAFFRNIRQSG